MLSNISILPIKVQNQILNEFLEEKSISTFKGLKITYWDYRDNKKDDFSKKAKYIHDKYSLDHPTKNSFGKKIHPYDPKQTQYEIAYRLARKVTRRAILLYFSNFKKAEINNIKQYNL